MTGLDRARDDLAAAQLLCTGGFAAQAVERAFAAARHAAEAALLLLGETRSTPAAIVAVFVQRVVHERGLDPRAGQLLRSLHNRCRHAEDSYAAVPQAEAATALCDATIVLDAISEWLEPASPADDAPRVAATAPPQWHRQVKRHRLPANPINQINRPPSGRNP